MTPPVSDIVKPQPEYHNYTTYDGSVVDLPLGWKEGRSGKTLAWVDGHNPMAFPTIDELKRVIAVLEAQLTASTVDLAEVTHTHTHTHTYTCQQAESFTSYVCFSLSPPPGPFCCGTRA